MAKAKENELYFCYGCMNQLESGRSVCPSCGYDNSKIQNSEELLPEGTVLSGKYLVGKKLGRGGFGVTYIGYDLMLESVVAIKEYLPVGLFSRNAQTRNVSPVSAADFSDGFLKGRQAFRTEALNLARFNSPHIVHIRDFLLEHGTAYIVMDFIRGNDLSKEMKICGGRIPWQRVLALFQPLLPELETLHEKKLIHRDIKPPNLKVVPGEDGHSENLVLLDFGAARSFVSENVEQHMTAVVTPGFAPPEQFSSKARQGPYTDIYGVCATMYCAITGETPPTATDILVGAAKLKSLDSFGLGIPQRAVRAIHHGMELRAEMRPQSMLDLSRELYPDGDMVRPAAPAASIDRQIIDELEDLKQFIYNDAISAMSANTAAGCKEALRLLKRIPNYKDANILSERCSSWLPMMSKNGMTGKKPDLPYHSPERQKRQTAERYQKGDIVTFGSYSQESSQNSTKTPIRWKVLDADRGRALLLCCSGLEMKPFNDDMSEENDWASSSLRQWLNTDFYRTAFNDAERSRIIPINLDKSDLTDRVFLLSLSEAEYYLPTASERRCKGSSMIFSRVFLGSNLEKYANWWLRTGTEKRYFVYRVDIWGNIPRSGVRMDSRQQMVRPSLYLAV